MNSHPSRATLERLAPHRFTVRALPLVFALLFSLSFAGCRSASTPSPSDGGAMNGTARSNEAHDSTQPAPHDASPQSASPKPGTAMTEKKYAKPTDDELKRRLSPLAYQVTQHDATEPPFQNAYWNNHEAGLYVDVASGEPLFSSRDKFDSGTGWPSFTRPVEAPRIIEKRDSSHGMVRVEVRSRDGNSHLGHLFDDGPRPTGQRYCINSASIRFIPLAQLEKEGYGDYIAAVAGPGHEPSADDQNNSCAAPAPGAKAAGEVAGCETTLETALLAGGCFWGMEDILRNVPGVLETEVGYTGGSTKNPSYETVKRGDTGHAESIRVVFDPKKISYAELLENWFFRMHDPTTVNRQGNDRGTQYRSAIFTLSAEQKQTAEAVKKKVDASGKWDAPVVTEIVDAGTFTPAESYHQDYLEVHPGGYTCHFLR